MHWPSTEVLIFGLLAALLLAGSLANFAWRLLASRNNTDPPANADGRLWLLLSLISLILLAAVLLYFWFLDPASDSLRQWLGLRQNQSV